MPVQEDLVRPRTSEDRERLTRSFFPGTGASYDRVVLWTTLGLDRTWKRALMAEVPLGARRILDLACGTGIVLKALHRRCPHARLVGVDMTDDYLAVARRRFARSGAALDLVLSNAETMELEGTFDVVVSSYLPKYVDPDVVLERLAPHVHPHTVLAVHDFGAPHGLARHVWRGWMRVLQNAGPRLWPEWRTVFDENLEALILRSPWHRSWPRALERHGWTAVRRDALSFRTAYLVRAERP